ncbi:MAG: Gfo/Idh/MocA family oxidoreductase [Chloroflexi bacterium]|nr:Gfo/Idh/MocA family oxidoreductase [Chloroflexota bacterium]
MEKGAIRIGIVGAGANTRLRHIPGLKAQPGVDLVSVCNRSRESSGRVAAEFGIPTVYDNWLDLVDADDTDAIVIGTWPYLHCPVTLAALEASKHVLCEARMALDAGEARLMLEVARRSPDLVAQVVPSPFTFKVDRTVQDLIAKDYLGDVLAIDLQANSRSFVDTEAPLHWRQDRDLSGYNVLTMGIWYEALMRWVGPATKVTAMTKVNVPLRRDAEGVLRAVTVPDHVEVLCDMACGALAHLRFSAVTGLAPADGVWLYGSQGTLHLDASKLALYGGRRGDKEMRPIEVPAEKQGRWRVEEEFINAVRGIEKVKYTTFEDGVKYMEFTEAVARSAATGKAVGLGV